MAWPFDGFKSKVKETIIEELTTGKISTDSQVKVVFELKVNSSVKWEVLKLLIPLSVVVIYTAFVLHKMGVL